MAQDAGVSAAEFRKLSQLGPEGADLLLRRMEALDLDPKEVGATERRTLPGSATGLCDVRKP